MKALLIALSLAANAALLALVLTRTTDSTATKAASASSSPNSQTSTLNSAPGSASSPASVDPKLWRDLVPATADLPSLVARLRAAGFPPNVIRALVSAQVRADYAARRRALHPTSADTPFWKNDLPTDPKTRLALRELAREQEATLNQLFGGPDPDRSLVMSVMERRQVGDLPPEKAAQLSTVKRDYDEMRSEIYAAASGGTMLPEDRAKLALLEKEQRADLAQFLTPQELEDYDLRTSNTASMMRYNLSAFNPTETEFRAIFKLQQALDTQVGPMGPGMTPEQMRARNDAQKLLNDQIKAALGPERGADYERANDFAYRQANLVAERLSLPPTTASSVWTLQKDFEQRRTALGADQSLDAPTRSAQLTALQQETLAKVTTLLTPRGTEIYRQNGGFWVQQLQPRPAGANNTSTISSGGTTTIITTPKTGG